MIDRKHLVVFVGLESVSNCSDNLEHHWWRYSLGNHRWRKDNLGNSLDIIFVVVVEFVVTVVVVVEEQFLLME